MGLLGVCLGLLGGGVAYGNALSNANYDRKAKERTMQRSPDLPYYLNARGQLIWIPTGERCVVVGEGDVVSVKDRRVLLNIKEYKKKRNEPIIQEIVDRYKLKYYCKEGRFYEFGTNTPIVFHNVTPPQIEVRHAVTDELIRYEPYGEQDCYFNYGWKDGSLECESYLKYGKISRIEFRRSDV